jgi:Icc-related predicted phosphoesterase
MMQAVAVTDLHGNRRLYELLLRVAGLWKLTSIFISGDLAPSAMQSSAATDNEGVEIQRLFFTEQFIPLLGSFLLENRHSDIYVIMGNDDRRANEPLLQSFDHETPNFHLVDDRLVPLRDSHQKRAFFPREIPLLWVAGYPYVPPGGTLLMDWVKYENRAKIRPMGMDPSTDIYKLGIATDTRAHRSTIAEDLSDFSAYLQKNSADELSMEYDPARTIHLFHCSPYGTSLDWTTPRGRYELLPLADHVGSMEIKRFIERTQPYLVLSGHCHESVVIGNYRDNIGNTPCINPGSQAQLDVLSLVRFNLYNPLEIKQFFIHAR